MSWIRSLKEWNRSIKWTLDIGIKPCWVKWLSHTSPMDGMSMAKKASWNTPKKLSSKRTLPILKEFHVPAGMNIMIEVYHDIGLIVFWKWAILGLCTSRYRGQNQHRHPQLLLTCWRFGYQQGRRPIFLDGLDVHCISIYGTNQKGLFVPPIS